MPSLVCRQKEKLASSRLTFHQAWLHSPLDQNLLFDNILSRRLVQMSESKKEV